MFVENTRDMDEPPAMALMEAPPNAAEPTDYDWAHRICYLRLLDADAAGADWRDAAQTVMKLDPDADPDGARASWESHLKRANWMTTNGYRDYMGTTTTAPGATRAD